MIIASGFMDDGSLDRPEGSFHMPSSLHGRASGKVPASPLKYSSAGSKDTDYEPVREYMSTSQIDARYSEPLYSSEIKHSESYTTGGDF